MNSKYWTSALIASLLAFGSAQASAAGWYYDEDADTIVYNVEGSRTYLARTNPTIREPVQPTGPWYYDEDSDTIVYNTEGSRTRIARTSPTVREPMVHIGAWYFDEDSDSVVLNQERNRGGDNRMVQASGSGFDERSLHP
jgi:hypothetical protein